MKGQVDLFFQNKKVGTLVAESEKEITIQDSPNPDWIEKNILVPYTIFLNNEYIPITTQDPISFLTFLYMAVSGSYWRASEITMLD